VAPFAVWVTLPTPSESKSYRWCDGSRTRCHGVGSRGCRPMPRVGPGAARLREECRVDMVSILIWWRLWLRCVGGVGVGGGAVMVWLAAILARAGVVAV